MTRIYSKLSLPDGIGPNHKSQIASDFKSRSPNRKNIPQIAAKNASNRSSSQAICDLKPFSNRSAEPFKSLVICVWRDSNRKSQRFGALRVPGEVGPPPYREIGVATPLSHYVSRGIANSRCYAPFWPLKTGRQKPTMKRERITDNIWDETQHLGT